MLLVAAAFSLLSMNVLVGTLFAACVLASPFVLAVILSGVPIGDDWSDN
jgi:hypothetical protein